MKTISKIATTIATVALSFTFSVSEAAAQPLPYDNEFCFGLDLSFVKSNEERGRVYYDLDGTQKTPWEIFRGHGYNWGRLMICSEPSYLGQGIDYVVKGAKELKKNNYHFLLDYMLSDDWSNPMKQPLPKSMDGMTPKQIEKALYDFVYSTMKRLKDEGVMPEMVQMGNEISNGCFWPTGRVFYGDERKDESNWKQFTAYIKAGIKAVRDVDTEGKVKIMLHEDFGGDRLFSEVFFSMMEKYKVDYDIIGFSYYPWSHGTLMDLRANLAFVTGKFHKPVIVVETGFYSVPSQYFERIDKKAAFPETPEGQKQWFRAVNDIVMAVPGNMGLGTFWWEPMQRGRGFFDDKTNVVKPVVTAFEDLTSPADRTDGNPRIWDFDEMKQ